MSRRVPVGKQYTVRWTKNDEELIFKARDAQRRIAQMDSFESPNLHISAVVRQAVREYCMSLIQFAEELEKNRYDNQEAAKAAGRREPGQAKRGESSSRLGRSA